MKKGKKKIDIRSNSRKIWKSFVSTRELTKKKKESSNLIIKFYSIC